MESFALSLAFIMFHNAYLLFDTQVTTPITATIGLDWDVTSVGKPIPAAYTTQVTNGTVLVDILNKAANDNPEGPFNKYDSTYYGGLGHFITAMNGTEQVSMVQISRGGMTYSKTFYTGKPHPKIPTLPLFDTILTEKFAHSHIFHEQRYLSRLNTADSAQSQALVHSANTEKCLITMREYKTVNGLNPGVMS